MAAGSVEVEDIAEAEGIVDSGGIELEVVDRDMDFVAEDRLAEGFHTGG